MLKCKHERCQYPNCEGENCGLTVEQLLTMTIADNASLRNRIKDIYSVVANAPLRNALHALSKLTSEVDEYEITCPFGYGDCISDPAYIRAWHPEWWIELGRPTECSCHFSKAEVEHMTGCPYYDDEDK